MFNAQKFARKYAKIVLGVLCGVMCISLVLWIPGMDANLDPTDTIVEGRIFGEIDVSRGEFRGAVREARVWHRWNWFNEGSNLLLYFYRRQRPDIDEAKLRNVTWEYLVLLEEAERQQVYVSDNEVTDKVLQFFRMILGPQMTKERMYQQAEGMFGVGRNGFDRVMAKVTRIEKLLDLLTEGNFKLYSDVYAEIMDQNRMARVRVAGYDPKDFIKQLSRVKPNEVLKYYEENEDKFKVPEKVQVEYLMAAWEDFKGKVEQPTEDDMKAYHKDNVQSFPRPKPEKKEDKPDAGHEGHDHPPGQHPGEEDQEGDQDPEEDYLTFDEARMQVYDLMIEERARAKANELFNKINIALGEMLADKQPKDIQLDSLLAPFTADGTKLRHGISTNFTQKNVDDVEKAENLGTGTQLGVWAFNSDIAVFEFSPLVETEKGYLIFQLRERKEPYAPGLTQEIEERIKRHLSREQLQTRATTEAERIKKIIETKGFGSGRIESQSSFETSAYFSMDGTESVGLSNARWDTVLRNQVRTLVTADPPQIGQCSVVNGSAVDPEKRLWTYLVYLDDVVPGSLNDLHTKFSGRYSQQNTEHRTAQRNKIVARMIAEGAVQDLNKPGKKEGEPVVPPDSR